MTVVYTIESASWRPSGSDEPYHALSIRGGTLIAKPDGEPSEAMLSVSDPTTSRELHRMWTEDARVNVRLRLREHDEEQEIEATLPVAKGPESGRLEISGFPRLSRERVA